MNALSPAHLGILFLFLLLLVGLGLIGLRVLRGAGHRETSAEERLDRRYADGDLSREDYLRIKGDITGRSDA